jgi:hypothetical protein
LSEWEAKPERLSEALQILAVVLSKPGDKIRWSIQPKQISPLLTRGFDSPDPQIRALATTCQDSLLKMGFFDFLNIGNK